MKEELAGCERANDLVSFLYEEMNSDEKQSFQRHLQTCRACSAELSAFKEIRTSVVTWRDESLVAAPAPAYSHPVPAPTKPSALAALREFFNLSPVWMKGATAFAALLFCLFTAMAISHWTERPQPAAVNPALKYTDADVKRQVDEEVARFKAQSTSSDLVVKETAPAPVEKISSRKTSVGTQSGVVSGRRPLTKTEREQLAQDLRLAMPSHEGEIDLLADRINQ